MKAKCSGFDKIAPFYDFLSWFFFANSIKKSQNDLLALLPKFKNVLIIGGGTGGFLLDLIALSPNATYHNIDISSNKITVIQTSILQ